MSSTISRKYMSARSNDAVRLLFLLSLVIAALIFAIGIADVFASNDSATETVQLEFPGLVIAVEAPPPVQEPEPATETLTPHMRAVLVHVTHRYRVSAEALVPIFETAQRTGREQSLDPLLIVAIIGIESRFNPFAQSPMGAQGLMQVIPRFHQEKMPEGAGKLSLFNPVTNVQVGAQVLQEAIRQRGGLMAGLQQFGGAENDEEQAYAAKVLAEKQHLERGQHLKPAGAPARDRLLTTRSNALEIYNPERAPELLHDASDADAVPNDTDAPVGLSTLNSERDFIVKSHSAGDDDIQPLLHD